MLHDLNSYKEMVFIGYGLVSQQGIVSIFLFKKASLWDNRIISWWTEDNLFYHNFFYRGIAWL